MHRFFEDILSRIDMEPLWFDENAVPRFVAFSPREVADIYADQVALVEIACQACGRLFPVAFAFSVMDRVRNRNASDLKDSILANRIGFGDPPNMNCCPAGPTMSSETRRVMEFWSRHDRAHTKDGVVTDIQSYCEWKRYPELEIAFPDDSEDL